MNEEDHTRIFPQVHRLSCFTHTLQLVVLKFNQDKSINKVLKKVYKLVSKVKLIKCGHTPAHFL